MASLSVTQQLRRIKAADSKCHAGRTPAGKAHGWTAELQCALGNCVFHQHLIRGSCQAEQTAVPQRNADKDIDRGQRAYVCVGG